MIILKRFLLSIDFKKRLVNKNIKNYNVIKQINKYIIASFAFRARFKLIINFI